MELIFSANTLYEKEISDSLARFDRERFTEGIWEKDHTLWSASPAEVSDRLGWLEIGDFMNERLSAITDFADEIRRDKIKHVVLLGMGGSSLGAEVLRQVFGSRYDYPELIVLDSTIPEAVIAVRNSIEPDSTLFLVSSKSGATTETLALYDYFASLDFSSGTGRHFAAITDAGSPLENLGRKMEFRQVFLNAADIGGRYSVLSYFGLVPAGLSGIDIQPLLASAEKMRGRCAQMNAWENDGCRLGAYLATMSAAGRDKVTIITSPELSSFGLWAEQLIAESTGKSGKGLVPVVAEPMAGPGAYGQDRQFIYMRLEGDHNSDPDEFVSQIQSCGFEVATIEAEHKFELGSAFYLWEFAIAAAGMLMGIQPFNQPDVEKTKQATRGMLKEYLKSGSLPLATENGSLKSLLSQAKPGDYFSIMAYLWQTPETDRIFEDLRLRVLEKYGLATTLGYGPRFLHSTGQLHKGGPNEGLFVQVIPEPHEDLPVPGRDYSFSIVSRAESLADLETLEGLDRRVISLELDPASLLDIIER